MIFEELEHVVIQWAQERGILESSDDKSQCLKFFAEAGELADAINKDDMDAITDSIGDVLVTLILTAYFTNNNLISSLESAYREISQRKGQMVNGVFVKESSDETPS